ncbi:MAG: ATP-binding protein [Thermoprotei archaeon]
MSVEDFRVVVAEWVGSVLAEVKPREVELPVEPTVVVSVIGPRRAGKTSLLYHTISKLIARGVPRRNVLYVDFEHPRLNSLAVEHLDNMIEAFYELSKPDPSTPIYLFLDEIQSVRDYGRWFRRRLNAKFYVSGSSSKLSSKNIAEELRGRSVDYTVYPLSFREYINFKGGPVDNPEIALYSEEKGGRMLSMLREYLRFGGYPAVALETDEREKIRLLRAYFNSVVVRDFAQTHRALAEPFIKFVVQNYAGYFSANRVYNYLRGLGYRLGKEKVLELLNTAVDCFFLFPLELYAKSERRRQPNMKKVYVVDTGYHTALGYDFSIGRSMKNAVMIELKRRDKEAYYWKEYGKSEGLEVDFVVAKNGEAQELVQVTYASENVRERELKALKKAKDETGARKLTIITWDKYAQQEGVSLVPLWYWLLT